jgi:hypothetical protein
MLLRVAKARNKRAVNVYLDEAALERSKALAKTISDERVDRTSRRLALVGVRCELSD